MDSGRPMIQTPGIIAKSNIHLVDETHLDDDPIDREVCRAANEAAKDLFLGNDNLSAGPPSSKLPSANTNAKDGATDEASDDSTIQQKWTLSTTPLQQTPSPSRPPPHPTRRPCSRLRIIQQSKLRLRQAQ